MSCARSQTQCVMDANVQTVAAGPLIVAALSTNAYRLGLRRSDSTHQPDDQKDDKNRSQNAAADIHDSLHECVWCGMKARARNRRRCAVAPNGAADGGST